MSGDFPYGGIAPKPAAAKSISSVDSTPLTSTLTVNFPENAVLPLFSTTTASLQSPGRFFPVVRGEPSAFWSSTRFNDKSPLAGYEPSTTRTIKSQITPRVKPLSNAGPPSSSRFPTARRARLLPIDAPNRPPNSFSCASSNLVSESTMSSAASSSCAKTLSSFQSTHRRTASPASARRLTRPIGSLGSPLYRISVSRSW